MKRTERHHLKENELEILTRHAREIVETRKREATLAIAAVVIIGAAVLGYVAWRDRTESRALGMLSEAMSTGDARVGPPLAPGTAGAGGLSFLTERARGQAALVKFKATADAYPKTDVGTFARYEEAATQMSLGNAADATRLYQQVVDQSGDGLYGQMARLGLAEAQARGGQYDQAINAFKELSQRKDGPLPVDGILMQLGRAYRDAGKRTDAQQTFTRLVEEYPDSPFNADAKKELESLKKT